MKLALVRGQLVADGGKLNDAEALKGLHQAMDAGVNFFDTADVYGSGHAEELLAEATKGKEDEIYIATKFCRAGDIHDLNTYSEESVRQYCESSLKRLKRERIDLYQIHCPPLSILKDGHVFEVLDKLKTEGKIRYYGVSVETVEEGLFSIGVPGVKALQVIYNLFRQKPAEALFPKAKAAGVGILVRLPLASGLLTGKFTETSTFAADDHRSFNADEPSSTWVKRSQDCLLIKVSSWPETWHGLRKAVEIWPEHQCAGFWTIRTLAV